MLSFLKAKLFNQVSAFISPFVLLIAVFLIWNSDLILTKFGYETRSNLRGQVAELQNTINNLKAENEKLKKEISVRIETATVVNDTMGSFYEEKDQTKNTVNDLINKRDQISVIESCPVEETTELEKIKPLTVIPPSNIKAVSKANITIINEAYASFFPENK